MCLGNVVYKFFTVFKAMWCYPLWLSTHNSSRLCGFFSRIFTLLLIIKSIMFNPGLWNDQSFNTVQNFTRHSVVLHTICCAEKSHLHPNLVLIGPSGSGYIWHYKTTVNFNFLDTSLFMYIQNIRPLPPNFTVLYVISSNIHSKIYF